MTLDEYKAYVEATRKESLLKAIATMSEAMIRCPLYSILRRQNKWVM